MELFEKILLVRHILELFLLYYHQTYLTTCISEAQEYIFSPPINVKKKMKKRIGKKGEEKRGRKKVDMIKEVKRKYCINCEGKAVTISSKYYLGNLVLDQAQGRGVFAFLCRGGKII